MLTRCCAVLTLVAVAAAAAAAAGRTPHHRNLREKLHQSAQHEERSLLRNVPLNLSTGKVTSLSKDGYKTPRVSKHTHKTSLLPKDAPESFTVPKEVHDAQLDTKATRIPHRVSKDAHHHLAPSSYKVSHKRVFGSRLRHSYRFLKKLNYLAKKDPSKYVNPLLANIEEISSNHHRRARSITITNEHNPGSCHVGNLEVCGVTTVQRLQSVTDPQAKCRIREEFFNCIVARRSQPCPDEAIPVVDSAALRHQLRIKFNTTNSCLAGYNL